MSKCRMELPEIIIFGPNNYYTLGLVRCIGEAIGKHCHCVIYGNEHGCVLLSKYPKVVYFDKSIKGCVGYIKSLSFQSSNRPIIIPANDFAAAELNACYNGLKTRFNIPYVEGEAGGGIIRLMDKKDQIRRAERYGFCVPKMNIIKKGDPLPANLTFPVFTKSRRTIDGGKCDEFVCGDYESLKDAVNKINAKEFIISQYIEKKYELNYFGLATKDDVYIPICNNSLRYCSTGYSGYQVYYPTKADDYLIRIKDMIKESGYRQGLFSVEFLVDKQDQRYFMEVNYRHDGATYRCMPGLNLPIMLCRSIAGESDDRLNFLIKRKLWFGINEIEDYRQAIRENNYNFIKWLWDWLRADRRMVFNSRDPLPFLYHITGKIFKRLKCIMNKMVRKVRQ